MKEKRNTASGKRRVARTPRGAGVLLVARHAGGTLASRAALAEAATGHREAARALARRAAAWLLACAMPAGAAFAETNGAASLPEPVTLEECIARSLDAAGNRGVFDSEMAFARADAAAARSRSYPHLNVIPDVRYYPGDAEIEGAVSADLGEHFLEIPQNRLHRRIAERNIARAGYRRDGLRNARRAATVQAYVDCLQTGKDLEMARMESAVREAAAAAWNELADDAPASVEQREAARRALLEARAASAQAEWRDRETRRRLSALCEFPAGAAFRMTPLPAFDMPPVGLDDCLAWAARHSELACARHEFETSEWTIRLARMGRRPTAGLSFGYTDRGQDEFDDGESGSYGALHLRIPLWDAGETRANVARLQARRDSLGLEMERIEADLEKNVSAAFAALRRAVDARTSAQSDPAPERRFRAAEARFRNGELAGAAFAEEQMNWDRHKALILSRNWDCYRSQADLLAAIEATDEELRAGLPSGTDKAEGP